MGWFIFVKRYDVIEGEINKTQISIIPRRPQHFEDCKIDLRKLSCRVGLSEMLAKSQNVVNMFTSYPMLESLIRKYLCHSNCIVISPQSDGLDNDSITKYTTQSVPHVSFVASLS